MHVRKALPKTNAKAAGNANRLLATLPPADLRRVVASCEHVELQSHDVLYEAGAPLRHVYFPTSAFISLVTPLDACAGLEVALVGNEGMVGSALLLGVAVSPLNHLVQGTGGALRIDTASFKRELLRCKPLRLRLNRYAYVKMHQFAQTAACTRFHLVEARLARWLLMTHDRSASDAFYATHEFLAYMLGVRRVGITRAATALQRQS
jgi:CRP-like cAMP-binding protein